MIQEDLEAELHAALAAKCSEMKCPPIAIGGTSDHVHLLVELRPAVSVASLVGELKGSSSHLLNKKLPPGEIFKWQGAYGAFSLRKCDVPALKQYISTQKEHHKANTMLPEWEQTQTD